MEAKPNVRERPVKAGSIQLPMWAFRGAAARYKLNNSIKSEAYGVHLAEGAEVERF